MYVLFLKEDQWYTKYPQKGMTPAAEDVLLSRFLSADFQLG